MKAAKSMKFAKTTKAPAAASGKLALPFTKKKKPDEAMAPVEGSPAKQRLDRPGRKMRADGGRISEDSKEYALQKKISAAGKGLHSAVAGVGTVLPYGKAKTFRTFLGGTSALMAADAKKDWDEAKRVERGEAEPGKEDRKAGGRVAKKGK